MKQARMSRSFISLTGATIVALGLTGCFGGKVSKKTPGLVKTDDAQKADTVIEETQEEPVLAATPTLKDMHVGVGFRNHERLNLTMASVTGLPAFRGLGAGAQADPFAVVKDQINADVSAKAFVASKAKAAIILAANYCDTMMRNATVRAQVLGSVSLADTAAVTDALTKQFWGSALSTLPDKAQVTQVLSAMHSDIRSGTERAWSDEDMTYASCVVVLSAPPVVFF